MQQHCSTLQYTATHCNNHQESSMTARCCNPLQHIATDFNSLLQPTGKLKYCNLLQHIATRCNTLQHPRRKPITATHCNTLQHTATHCNTLQQPTGKLNDMTLGLTHSAATPPVSVRVAVRCTSERFITLFWISRSLYDDLAVD